VKAEVEVTDTNWAGLFPGRLARACAAFEQTRVNDEVWLPRRVQVFLSARLGLVKMLHIEQEVIHSKCREFQTVPWSSRTSSPGRAHETIGGSHRTD